MILLWLALKAAATLSIPANGDQKVIAPLGSAADAELPAEPEPQPASSNALPVKTTAPISSLRRLIVLL
ncbi:hypothetical protein RSal33209_0594 [Renibacterium salmoninarum ATCC 33209]|uniref:Uncharacterized protein n=1 Tax=Renibacterium salmoninarum (strain ATCC 33209 / DSM 20767 / JCM 11484 / NBRC 15589 / NCIMB 2235) TaxID=288705 RepID=A9WLE4_RENSM|nr:hypothetical protein RSal33209_0594 [Renibacterium salmoninarum ATCC 33209]